MNKIILTNGDKVKPNLFSAVHYESLLPLVQTMQSAVEAYNDENQSVYKMAANFKAEYMQSLLNSLTRHLAAIQKYMDEDESDITMLITEDNLFHPGCLQARAMLLGVAFEKEFSDYQDNLKDKLI